VRTAIPDDARLIQVMLPYAVFGVVVRNGFVIDAAPIACWAIGRPEEEVALYYRHGKGARFREAVPAAAVSG
jgi:hypothetical protein